MHASLRRAIVASSIVVVIAMLSVTTIAWLRRPRVTGPAEARPPVPLSYNDEDGSVYDLRLRMDDLRSGLEQRLLESERERQQLQKQVEGLLTEQESMAKRLEEMDRQLVRLRRKVAEQPPAQRAQPSTNKQTLPADSTNSTNAATETTPPAGASGTPTSPTP